MGDLFLTIYVCTYVRMWYVHTYRNMSRSGMLSHSRMRRQEDIKVPRPRKGNTCSYNMYEVDYNACTFLCTCFLF